MKIWTIAREDLRLTLRDRTSTFWIFIAPFIWVYFFGFLAQAPDPSRTQIGLMVIQEDASPLAERLIQQLEGEGFRLTVVKPGEQTPEGGRSGRRVTIPAGFGDAVARREKVILPISEGRDANPQGTLATQVALHKAVMRLLAAEAFGQMAPADDIVTVQSSFATVHAIPSGNYQTIPGNLVMFVLIATMTYGSSLLAQDRRIGMLRRLSAAPLGHTTILAGKLVGRMAVASLQVSVFLLIGLAVFRIEWGSSPLGLVLLLGSFVFCAAALGMLGGALFSSDDAASGVGITVCMIMSAIGGCWWPMEVMPSWMRAAAYFFPTGWAMNGMHALISWGGGLADVGLHVIVIAVFGLAALFGAVRILDVTA